MAATDAAGHTMPAKRPSKRQLVRAGKIRPSQKSVQEIHDNIVVERKRVEVPLHLYLIEQDEVTQTVTVSSQTDTFLEEPPEPAFIPRKTGVDIDVQVDTDEVFDYDRDVGPILEVVISKTLEQGLIEVRQEEELKRIARSKGFYEEKARKRLMAAQELERKEKEAVKEKEEVMGKARERAGQEKQLHLKLASNVFAEAWLQNIQQTCFDELDRHHYFTDPVSLAVRSFMPWLVKVVHTKTEEVAEGQKWVDGLIQSSLAAGKKQQSDALRERAQERERLEEEEAKRLAEEEEQKKREQMVQLYIHTDVVPNSPVGPISLKGTSTVEIVEQKILEWLQENVDDPPDLTKLKFLWNGQTLARDNVLYDLGVENLSTITMVLEE